MNRAEARRMGEKVGISSLHPPPSTTVFLGNYRNESGVESDITNPRGDHHRSDPLRSLSRLKETRDGFSAARGVGLTSHPARDAPQLESEGLTPRGGAKKARPLGGGGAPLSFTITSNTPLTHSFTSRDPPHGSEAADINTQPPSV